MKSKKIFALLAVVFGVVFVGLAVYYWATPANALPSYFPGYTPVPHAAHFKHGLASLLLGLILFVYAWFATGKKSAEGK